MRTADDSDHSSSATKAKTADALRKIGRRVMTIFTMLAIMIAVVALSAWPMSRLCRLTFESAGQSITISDESLTILSRMAGRHAGANFTHGWAIERAPESPPADARRALTPTRLCLSADSTSFFVYVPLAWIGLAAFCAAVAAWATSRATSIRQILLIGGMLLSCAAGAVWAFSVSYTMISEQTRTKRSIIVDAGRLIVSTVQPKARIAQFVSDVFGRGDASRLFVASRNTIMTNAPRMSLWKPQFGAKSILQQRYHYLPLWMPFAAFSAATLMLAITGIRKRRPPGHCKHCNYNLTGNQSNKCPECGTPTAASTPPAPGHQPHT